MKYEICKICNEMVNLMTDFHTQKHGMSLKEYRIRYGKNVVNTGFHNIRNKQSDVDLYSIEKSRKLKSKMIRRR